MKFTFCAYTQTPRKPDYASREGDADDREVLHRLTGEDLRELGVASVGHRRRLLDAIGALRNGAPQPVTETTPAAAVASSDAGATVGRRCG